MFTIIASNLKNVLCVSILGVIGHEVYTHVYPYKSQRVKTYFIADPRQDGVVFPDTDKIERGGYETTMEHVEKEYHKRVQKEPHILWRIQAHVPWVKGYVY